MSSSALSRAALFSAWLGAAPAWAAAGAVAPDHGSSSAGSSTSAPDAGPESDGATASPSTEGESSGGAGLFEQSVSSVGAASPDTPKSAAAAASSFQLSGYTRGDFYVGKVPGYAQGSMKAGYGELSLISRAKKDAMGDAFAEVRLRYGMQGDPQQEVTVDVREAYVNAYLGPLDLRLGKQIVVWGRADLLNPTSNITPVDFRIRSPIEDDRRIGNVGARGFLRLAPLPMRLEGVWMPNYVASEVPTVALPQYVSYDTPRYTKTDLDRGLLAGRLHLELPSIEMSASYLHGYAPMPGLSLSSLTINSTNPQVLIARTAYRQQVVGFDFSTAIGDILAIRGEAAYRRPYSYQDRINAPHPDLQYALGGDHTFGSVSVIAQYVGRYVFSWVKEPGIAHADTSTLKADPTAFLNQSALDNINAVLGKTNQMLFSQTEKVQHLGTVRVEWLTLHDTLSISALGMVNVTTKEWLASPKIGYRMSDSLIAYVGAEILTGPTGTLFGLVDQKMSAGYVELRSTF